MSIKSLLSGAAAVSAAVLSAAAPADLIRIEAESFTPDSTKRWAVKEHFDKWYTSRPSGGKFLAAPFGKNGSAATTVKLEKAGTYRLHMRRLDIVSRRASFWVVISQNGKELAAKEFDRTALRGTPEAKKKYGGNYVHFVWENFDFTAEAGEITITVKSGDIANGLAIGSRHLDTFWLTQDLNYVPNMRDTVKLYLRVRINDGQKTPGVIHYFIRRAAAPYYEHGNIGKKGLFVGPLNGSNKKFHVAAGYDSGWIEFASHLHYIAYDQINFYAMDNYYKKSFAGADYELIFSTTPDDSGIIKRFNGKGGANGQGTLNVEINIATGDIREFIPAPPKPARKAPAKK